MKDKHFKQFYLLSLASIIAISLYPIWMGLRVTGDMLRDGSVLMERYPKYVIPYTPISIAVILGVLLIPLLQRLAGKPAFLWGAGLSIIVFFLAEWLMETRILVLAEGYVVLESWQMSLCFVPPDQFETRTWQAVDVLLGGYSPAFKLHFYLISVALILSLLNCFYGFAGMIRSGNHARKKTLVIQAVTSAAFLGMCIWACFTSFYRTGELTIPAISAVLMAVFFTLLGITTGVFAASFTLGKGNGLSVLLPAMVSVFTTLAMYLGEMILLDGNLYRFGSGVLFRGMGRLVLAPVDLFLLLLSGGITALICRLVNHTPEQMDATRY